MEDEKTLVQKFSELRSAIDEKNEALDQLKEELSVVEYKLLKLLEADNKQSTARYEGIGFISIEKPKLKVSVNKADEDRLFEFVRASDREMFIKESIHPSTLVSFVDELITKGAEIPEFIKYYLQPKLKFYRR